MLDFNENADIAIIEIGANKPGEIEMICKIIKPEMGIITNIAEAHLSNFGSINEIAKTKRIIYIVHPSIKNEAYEYLHKRIIKLDGLKYEDMVEQIKRATGIITDSGGLQEEAVCAGKKVLICRDTTERPETIDSGWGKLVGTKILDNLDYLHHI